MTISYHSGGRLQGTSTDYNSGDGTPAEAGGWKEIGRTTLGSSNATIDVASLDDKRYYMVLTDITDSNDWGNVFQRLGNGSYDSGSNYSYRYSANGASGVTQDCKDTQGTYGDAGETGEKFIVSYLANLDSKEKLSIHNGVGRGTGSGAGNAPNRWESVDKWTNTSNVINQIQTGMYSSCRTFNSGSEVVVLGWDTDNDTDNFWEELTSVELSSAGDQIDSGTITAKKYLWVQLYTKPTGSANVKVRFNSDSGDNYSYRLSENGGSEITAVDNPEISSWISQTNPHFYNMFIVNNSATEKLLIGNVVGKGTAGAGNAPNRQEFVGKWDTTGSQITNITANNSGTGDYDTGSFIKVWGSN
jgi:hypothetical protein